MRYWKFLLIVFKSTNHRNYAKESVNLLCQYYYKFSERKKAQLLWSRCVNTRGYAGANIPCDLYMEHLNRRLKTIIRGMGSNISPSRIQRASRSLAAVQRVCDTFERKQLAVCTPITIPILLSARTSEQFYRYWKMKTFSNMLQDVNMPLFHSGADC